jgi:hypothetical protein
MKQFGVNSADHGGGKRWEGIPGFSLNAVASSVKKGGDK